MQGSPQPSSQVARCSPLRLPQGPMPESSPQKVQIISLLHNYLTQEVPNTPDSSFCTSPTPSANTPARARSIYTSFYTLIFAGLPLVGSARLQIKTTETPKLAGLSVHINYILEDKDRQLSEPVSASNMRRTFHHLLLPLYARLRWALPTSTDNSLRCTSLSTFCRCQSQPRRSH